MEAGLSKNATTSSPASLRVPIRPAVEMLRNLLITLWIGFGALLVALGRPQADEPPTIPGLQALRAVAGPAEPPAQTTPT